MLDSYGDRLMYRLAYRNFGTYESLVANHTVQCRTNGNTQTGIRWYELRNTRLRFRSLPARNLRSAIPASLDGQHRDGRSG